MERVVQGAHQAVDRMAEKAAPAVERLRGHVGGATEHLQSRTSRVMAMEEEWIEATRACVREHPIASIGVAVLAGMVLNKLTSSR
jgi:ElaB/YqjD/DUF883 family membrane-anchored ribosome-binding protein